MAASRYDKALARGLKPTEAWNESTVDWTVAAKVCVGGGEGECICVYAFVYTSGKYTIKLNFGSNF